MYKKQPGSLLLEAILSLGLTTLLILSVISITNNMMHALKEINLKNDFFLKINATSNQLFKDLSTLVVIKKKKKDTNKIDDKKTEKEKDISRTLIAQASDDEIAKINKQDFLNLKTINGITTSTLKSADERKPQLVRFCYKLINQKMPKPHDKIRAFKLYRKETVDLNDFNLKDEADSKSIRSEVSHEWILICDNIADLVLQFSTFTPDDEKKEAAPDKKTSMEEASLSLVQSFNWPNAKLGESYKERMPTYISVILRLWNHTFSKTIDTQFIIPCYAWTSCLENHDQKEKIPETQADTKKTPDSTKPFDQTKNPSNKTSPQKTRPPDSEKPNDRNEKPQDLENQNSTEVKVQRKSDMPESGNTTAPESNSPQHQQITTESYSREAQLMKLAPMYAPDKTMLHRIPIPNDVQPLMQAFAESPLGKISNKDIENAMAQMHPDIADHIRRQAEELERNPDKMFDMIRQMTGGEL
jgi:hypothetical protein